MKPYCGYRHDAAAAASDPNGERIQYKSSQRWEPTVVEVTPVPGGIPDWPYNEFVCVDYVDALFAARRFQHGIVRVYDPGLSPIRRRARRHYPHPAIKRGQNRTRDVRRNARQEESEDGCIRIEGWGYSRLRVHGQAGRLWHGTHMGM
jgi:hypothetical protein